MRTMLLSSLALALCIGAPCTAVAHDHYRDKEHKEWVKSHRKADKEYRKAAQGWDKRWRDAEREREKERRQILKEQRKSDREWSRAARRKW